MIFRFKALSKRRDPDRLDAAMSLANPRGWIATLVVASCLAMFGTWAALGKVPHVVMASGRLMYPGGIVHVESPLAGQLTDLFFEPGQVIAAGDTVATVQQDGRDAPVRAGFGGRVVRIDTSVGAVVSAGSHLLSVEPGYQPGRALQADLLVPATVIGSVEVGASVLMAVAGHQPRTVGLLRGSVTKKAPFPEGTEDGTVGPTWVTVTLTSADTTSGAAWTSARGPDAELVSQTPVDAEIVVGGRSPMSAFFGG